VALVAFAGCGKKAIVKENPVLLEHKDIAVEKKTPIKNIYPDKKKEKIDLTLYFGFDSDYLTDSEAMKLKVIPVRSDAVLYLVGGACPIGDEDYNDALGTKRALVVADELAKLGYDVRLIMCASVGEYNLVSSDPASYWMNRRVRVTTER